MARPRSCISAVNYAEVIDKLIEQGFSPDTAQAAVDLYGCDIVDASKARGALAGRMHAVTKGKDLSLGDRFCLGLAAELGLPVLTADRRWKDLDIGIKITLIR